VLVVVKDGDVELYAQAPFDLKTARRGDVLEVDGAEGWGRRFDERDDLIDVLGVDAQRERVDAGELNNIALPSMTGIAASGPMSPSPRTAVPSETIATVWPLIVSARALPRSSWIASDTRATPGV